MLTILLSSILLSSGPVAKSDTLKAYGALPTERQLKWQEMETYCLIHYTPTTFQNKEWGYGDAQPSLFNPSAFDANQIAKAAAAGGFRGLISVAKHHDGFCLWPTKTTSYSIASSPWENGKGDMVKDFMQATHRNGMKFGVYLSAWDRHDERYGTPAYAEAYRQQLTELMSNYGPLFTSWHDGANGGDGFYGGHEGKRIIDRTTYYEWHEKTWPIVRKLQPEAVIFSDIGPDMRWVGNEKGFAAETSWATFTPIGLNGKVAVPGATESHNAETGDRNGKYWIPAECDVPQRPGWFYHEEQNSRVKTPDQLFEIYLKSVGRGACMNLGLAPMPSGTLHENDVKSLEAFGKKVKETFRTNLAKGATITASNVRNGDSKSYGTSFITDNDRYSYWATDDSKTSATLEIKLKSPAKFDLIQLRENIKLGQRIDSVSIERWENNSWKPLAKATSIGANRLIKLEQPQTGGRLRLHVYAPVAITLSDFGLFKEYNEPFAFNTKEVKKLTGFKISTGKSNNNAFISDGKPTTFATVGDQGVIVVATDKPVSGIGFLPRQDGKTTGTPTHYKISTSADGKTWTLAKEGEFSNIKANPILQQVFFDTNSTTKFIKFEPKQFIEGNELAIAEFELYGK
ncbi:MAG: alpha-L-fucosidase [Sphingobacterium sp.]|jgi:alpha-L-fucosidase|uniref:alpha-L-fucosidase n=1 Tax=Sphingobacterium sp. TaxID=341027 RepID=UPI002841EC36|nr:alpha-L-fucosidase [Sphingobacterium sp.]MDR3010020.1 alpha-L-fucosidase [Sphingobacterium sp.]